MIKYIYVLTSDENDYYLEQALMSITSLKMRMPDGFVTLLIDDKTERTLLDKRRKILELVDELKVVEIAPQFNKKECSRWLKTSMRKYIEGDFLYIDCDTVICDDLNDIKIINIDLGAVLDNHVLLDNHHMKQVIQNNDKELGFNSSLVSNKHFNGGLLYCRDVPVCHDFFNQWHKLWQFCVSKGIEIDQPSLNQTNVNFDYLITKLNEIWNCQIVYGGILYLTNAKIIHYFATNTGKNPYLLANPQIFQQIRKEGSISQIIEDYLQRPKEIFDINTRLISNKEYLYMIDSPLFYSKKMLAAKKLLLLICKLLSKTVYVFLALKRYKRLY